MIRPRLLVPALLLALAFPGVAEASSRQLSIMQDDAVFLGLTKHDPDAAMAEAKALGADMVRTFLVWRRVSPTPTADAPPAGFDLGNPGSPGYDWSLYDRFVDRARRNGLKVFLTLAPGIPDWASEEPSRCPHFTGGYRELGLSCHWRPRTRMFSQFATAAAQRYSGRVDLWSLYNEPNLEHYLYPQLRSLGRRGFVDLAAVRYRRLWYEGWKAIARYDPARRNDVLFGETAAISSPVDTLYAALCLDEQGRPFRGRLRGLHGCNKPRKLPIGGIAHHPYNNFGRGSVFTRSFTLDSLPVAYIGRVSRLMRVAERHGRIPRGRRIFLTEFGFQTNPPDTERGQGLGSHARSINEADRLYFADRRVAAVAQFELYDAPEPEGQDIYNTGLRLIDGAKKPAWAAYRMPLVVTKLASDRVEVWGQVRPAEGAAVPSVQVLLGGTWATAGRPATNPAGYFRVKMRRRGAATLRWRLEWTSPAGEVMRSRVAGAGRKIRYLDRADGLLRKKQEQQRR